MKVPGRLIIVAALLIGSAGCSQNSPTTSTESPTYGEWPTFLPSPTGNVDQVLTGSKATPAVTVEGDAVQADLPGGGTVLIRVSGPAVPDQTWQTPPPAVPCTWTVEMSGATVPVSIAEADFAVTDSLGDVHWPTFAPGSSPAGAVQPAQTATFTIQTDLPPGEGILQWAPDGKNPVATWDFVVEVD